MSARAPMALPLVVGLAVLFVAAPAAAEDDYLSLSRQGARAVKARNLPKALESFAAAVRADPQQIDGYFNAGNVADRMKRCPEVLVYFRGFLHLSPGTPDDGHARSRLAACEKAATATLAVRSEPRDVEVTVDGAIVGRTPMADVKLAPGTYRVGLSCRCPDFQDASEEVVLKDGEPAEVSRELARTLTYGLLQVLTAPADGVRVYLDDREVGATPLEPLRLETRKYLLRLEKPGYDRWIRAVTVSRDRTVPVQATLEKTEEAGPETPAAPAGK